MRMVIAPGVTAVGQITKTGRRSFITHSESREFFWLEDEKGRGSYFYRSFAGTGGKQQGGWFSVGGVFADQRGEAIWIVKGSLRREPDYGRPTLGHFAAKVNAVLPHLDADVDRMIERLTGIKGGFGWDASADDLAVIPVFQLVSPVPKAAEEWGSWLLDFWKQNGLNRVWGKRGEVLNNPLNQGSDEKGRARDKRLQRWVGEQVTEELLSSMAGAASRGNKLYSFQGQTVSRTDMLQEATTHALSKLQDILEASDVEELMALDEKDPATMTGDDRARYSVLWGSFREAVGRAAGSGMLQIPAVRSADQLGAATTRSDRTAMRKFALERNNAIRLLKMYKPRAYVPSEKAIAETMYRIEYTRSPAKTLQKYRDNLQELQYPTYKSLDAPTESHADKELHRDAARALSTYEGPELALESAEEEEHQATRTAVGMDVIRDMRAQAPPDKWQILTALLELLDSGPVPDKLVEAVVQRAVAKPAAVKEVMREIKAATMLQLEEIKLKQLAAKRQTFFLQSPRLMLKNGRTR